jgi:polyisoprenoid-binding protein YceI
MTLARRSLLFALPLLFAGTALAQHETLTIDPAASEVKMTLKTNHDIVNGTFHVQSGNFDFTPTSIGGGIAVAAGSGNTGNGSRDKKMNKDILQVEKYTTVTFTPRSYTGTIAPTGDSIIQVTGILTLLGTPHDLTLPMQVHIDGPNCTARTHFVIPYVDWGLKDPSFMMWKAEKQVDIDLNLVGHLSK